jgi:hypothetical protein
MVDALIFSNAGIAVAESGTSSVSDVVLLVTWMMLIVGHRLVSLTHALSTVRMQRAAAKLATRGDPHIADVCQICSGDIIEVVNLDSTYDDADCNRPARLTSFDFEHSSSSVSAKLLDEWLPRVTGCGHVFHSRCITTWVVDRSPNCPVCGFRLKIIKSH